jgi:hypothetical protein
MEYDELYEKSWDLYKKNLIVHSLDEIMIAEIITKLLDRGYYLVTLLADRLDINARFDRNDGERIWVDLKVPSMSLGLFYGFGGICQLMIWKGVQHNVDKYLEGELKDIRSTLKKKPEPGVFMIKRDDQDFFVGTTVYVNLRDFVELPSLKVDVTKVMGIVDGVLDEIERFKGEWA